MVSARAAGAGVGTGNLRGDLVSAAAQFSIHLSHCLQADWRSAIRGDGQQVDVSLGDVHHWPFTGAHVLSTPWAGAMKTYAETAYVVVCAALRLLTPRATDVAPHGGEYVQLCTAHCGGFGDILLGLAVLTVTHAVARR